jgi:uncharacterized membrane protein
MGFWIFMLIMNLLIPATMIGFGRLFVHKAPGAINVVYGYRTAMSMKNQDTWDFAHKVAGAFWLKWGKMLATITILLMLLLLGKDEEFIGNVGGVLCMIQLIPLIYVIVPTERALKRTFDQNGNHKVIKK